MPNQGQQKTPDELQEEIEHTRAELDSTLDEIGRRLSPREIKERTVGYVKDTATSLSDTLQRNPVPVAIVGTALAATLLARQRSNARLSRERTEQLAALWDRLVDAIERKPSGFAAGDTIGRLSNLAVDAKDDLAHVLSGILTGAQRHGHDALAQAGHLGNGLAERAQQARASAGDRVHDVGRAAGDAAERILEDLTTTSKAHPYLTVAVALASGALLMAALRR